MNDHKKIIEVEKINFAYPGNKERVIHDVSFNIKEGEYICIVGHNGSGKSTLAKLLAALIFPQSGTIKIKEQLLTRTTRRKVRKPIGIIFQNPDNQFIGSTVRDDIAFGLENYNVPSEAMEEIIKNAAELCQITHLLDSSPQGLSGGQKQGVAIAGVLALNAEIIIFDEATSMLDPRGKVQVKKQMMELKTIHKKTVISITHDMSQILDADRVIALYKGKVLIDGTAKEILNQMEKLKVTKLDYPFSIKLALLLKKQGLAVPLYWKEKDLINHLKSMV